MKTYKDIYKAVECKAIECETVSNSCLKVGDRFEIMSRTCEVLTDFSGSVYLSKYTDILNLLKISNAGLHVKKVLKLKEIPVGYNPVVRALEQLQILIDDLKLREEVFKMELGVELNFAGYKVYHHLDELGSFLIINKGYKLEGVHDAQTIEDTLGYSPIDDGGRLFIKERADMHKVLVQIKKKHFLTYLNTITNESKKIIHSDGARTKRRESTISLGGCGDGLVTRGRRRTERGVKIGTGPRPKGEGFRIRRKCARLVKI